MLLQNDGRWTDHDLRAIEALYGTRDPHGILHPIVLGDIIGCMLHQSPFPQPAAALHLLLGTCAVESGFLDRVARGTRQGFGYFQLSRDREETIWLRHLRYNIQLARWFASRAGQRYPHVEALEHNVSYQVLLARTWYYWQDQASLPHPENVAEQAHLWRRIWRQSQDPTLEQDYITAYQLLVQPNYPRHRRHAEG